GHATTTCPTSTTASIFPTSASNTSSRDATDTRTLRSSRSTIAARTPRAWPDRDSRATGAAVAVVGVGGAGSIHVLPKTSYDESGLDAGLPQRQSRADWHPHAVRAYRAPGAVSLPRARLL